MKTCILLPAKKKEVDNYRERQMRHPICRNLSPLMMLLATQAGAQDRAMETAEEKDFADFFDMDARTIVLAGTNALADEVAKDWRITTAEKSYLFLSPNAGEGAEAAFAKFSENCL